MRLCKFHGIVAVKIFLEINIVRTSSGDSFVTVTSKTAKND